MTLGTNQQAKAKEFELQLRAALSENEMDSVITLLVPDLEAGLIPVINYGHTQLLQDIIERALRALMSEPLTSIS